MSASPAIPASTVSAYAAPRTVEEAVRALAAAGSTVVAGGTDLLVVPGGKWSGQPQIVNVRRVEEMRGIEVGADEVWIGALATVSDILEFEPLAGCAPVLRAAADAFASDQIRNMATVGGNLCNASPAGDLPVPLLVLDAMVDLASWSGDATVTRTVRLADFFAGPGRARLDDGELLTAVRFPVPPDGFAAGFAKTGPRPALEVAVVSAALGGVWSGGRLSGPRVAFGSVAPVPMRAAATEALLEGSSLDEAAIRAAGEAAAGEVSPISDVRASAWYRGHLVRTYTERLLGDVFANRD